MMEGLSERDIETFAEKVYGTNENKALRDAILANGINGSTLNSNAIISMNDTFSEEIETGKVANQKKSGRCWIFAALNTFRHRMSAQLNIKDFELSQNYMMFWDKLEKSNFFLESILKTLDEQLEDRLVSWLLTTPQQDGGQWDMLVSLVKKYGVVPKQAMPESYQSSNSSDLNSILNAKLRECALVLRRMHEEGKAENKLQEAKLDMLADIYKILVFLLGEPPKTFDFEYRDEEGKFHREINLTPQTFFEKYVGINLDDYVSIINAPTKDKPFGKTFTVKFLGNVIDGRQLKYLNVDIQTLKSLAIKQIKDGETVWFGSDVARYSDRKIGILDPELFDYEEAFGTHFNLTKAERLDYKESSLTHAMVLTGVNLIDGEPNRWKVENSWGEDVGNKGYFVMSDKWMDEYTYQIVVNKKYLSKELVKAYNQEPIQLQPWDPMGSLAIVK
ncbi:aminopeptidase C [Heyndrickxia ginsengihumi]|uniref:aminopeptidase C n=1 Tax=Heyndrickxia ginsengihumi TaxID=363870 RepID=UPI002040F8A6|nr:C1 family peptidase [Heyndrickxia ginsengihumi]MCM3022731.1 C1 family peptidase [Heyndrickxia ginsengihumi]